MIPDVPLHGLSLDRARLYGMPDLDLPRCVVCNGARQNLHHMAPKQMGGGSKTFLLETGWGKFVLESPVVALCGFGNASGCHGDAHAGTVSFEWVWDDEEVEERWWNGWLLSHGYAPHDPDLFRFGRWLVLRDKRVVKEVRL